MSTTNSKSNSNAVIDATEVVKTPRGRKAEVRPELLADLEQVKPGQAISLGGTFGEVPKAERQKVSAILRRHCQRAWGEGNFALNYSPAGVPQATRKA
jgi:hypothetical protein